MSFKAEVYRVLIASPSDLAEERQVAADAMHEWNAQHASAEKVVLLPVKWETHATPATGVRPQAAINAELVQTSDILVGMFWTKMGTYTGVAVSGTVEEVDQFVAEKKPAMLYFSSRPIDPNKINLVQQKKLRDFKAETYKNSLVGGFGSLEELKQTLARDLHSQVRKIKPRSTSEDIEHAEKITDLMVKHKKHNISPAKFAAYRKEILGPNRSAKELTFDPVPPEEVGPNGYRVGYTAEGDKVEWHPDEDKPGKEWPVVLRRNDNSILAASAEFETVIWYDRKLVMLQAIAEGKEKPPPKDIMEGMIRAMKKAEKEIGKRKIRQYYNDDFTWGMLNGKLSALRWVLGDDWDMLDT